MVRGPGTMAHGSGRRRGTGLSQDTRTPGSGDDSITKGGAAYSVESTTAPIFTFHPSAVPDFPSEGACISAFHIHKRPGHEDYPGGGIGDVFADP